MVVFTLSSIVSCSYSVIPAMLLSPRFCIDMSPVALGVLKLGQRERLKGEQQQYEQSNLPMRFFPAVTQSYQLMPYQLSEDKG